MSATSKTNRTDVAVIGPLASASDSGVGGNVFSIMRQISGETFLYAMLYRTANAAESGFTPHYQFVESGITAYINSGESGTTDFDVHYFKWRQPRDAGTVGSANINYYVIDAYPTLNDASNNTNKVGSLVWATDTSTLVFGPTPSMFEMDTDDPHSFPGLPSLLTGISYFPPQEMDSIINNRKGTGYLSSSDDATYQGLPTGVSTTNVGTGQENVYFMPFSWYYTNAGTNLAAASTNIVYHQCGPSSAVSAQTSNAYYTNNCVASLNRGLTSKTLAQQTDGNLPYFSVDNAKCGSAWPSATGDIVTYTGLDGVLVTATTTFGLADDGVCGWSDSKFQSMGLDSFCQTENNGKCNPDSGGIPWWLFFLILGIIVIIGLIIYVSIHLSHGKHKSEDNGTGREISNTQNMQSVPSPSSAEEEY